MTVTAITPPQHAYATFRAGISAALRRFLDGRGDELLSLSRTLEPVLLALRDFLVDGGKRLRPAFCYWGWQGAGGSADEPGIVSAAAALELLHGCALIHDDIMDASDMRRGKPSIHRRFASLHSAQGLRGSAEDFGVAAAILVGDLCLTWCEQMFDNCRLTPAAIRAAKSLFHLMHTEVVAGQYLDMVEQGRRDLSIRRARTVMRYKTAKYTIERPLQLGALLADADAELVRGYSRFALPLGEAFQLRDDVLGVFGDSRATGKPAGDDLREGKHTVLVALAAGRGTGAQRAELETWLGDPELDDDGVRSLQSIIVETGALATVEHMIVEHTAEALRELDRADLVEQARAALADLAIAATQRAA